jgi:aryl-alcohol dehydrogenase-like predicted oxidoreductase
MTTQTPPVHSNNGKRALGTTGLQIAPLVFGGNVFGWTVDKATSFDLLDRFVDGGLNAIDTADMYSTWVPGNQGGESETIIGQWLKAAPSRREQVLIITKVGAPMGPDRSGLSAKRIVAAAEESLRRLQTDRIDLYFSHYPDEQTPMEESLRAYETLIQQGKVRAIGASNHSVAQLRDSMKVADDAGLPRYNVLQPEYNLYDRASYEGELRDLAVAEKLGVITYYSLASGFLTGKYRSKQDLHKSARGGGIEKYLDARGLGILDALDTIAKARGAQSSEVAVAWLIAREGVTAPIASATSIAQVDSLIRATQVALTADDISLLDKVSAYKTAS